MAIAWTTVQNALQAWVTQTSGLSTDVIWAYQHGPQPVLPYAMLKLGPPIPVAGKDQYVTTYVPSNPQGTEILETNTGVREVTLTVEVFSNTVTGSGTAMEYLGNAMSALYLRSQLTNLYEAGISVIDRGPLLDLSALVATKYQSRASCDIRLYVVDQVNENTGYIATVIVDPTIDGVALPDVDITVG